MGAATSIAAGCGVFYLRGYIGEANLSNAIAIACAGVFFGSLYPDTDAKSKSGFICNLLLLAAGLFYVFYFKQYYVAALFGGMFLVPILTKHRGPCHTVWFNAIIAFFIGFLISRYNPAGYLAGVGYFVGALDHICIDKIGNRTIRKIAIAGTLCFTVALLFVTGLFYGKDFWQGNTAAISVPAD